MKFRTHTRWLATVLALFGVFALVGCDDAVPYGTDGESSDYRSGSRSKAASLASFGTCEAVQDYVVDRYTDFIVDQQTYWRGDVFVDGDFAVPEAGDDSSGGEEPGDYTETNVQEAGVDEADIVKTNGTHIYFIQGSTLRVMKSFPPDETALLTELNVPGYNGELFLEGDQLIVLSHKYDSPYYPVFDYDDPCFDRPTEGAEDVDGSVEPGGCQPEDSFGPLGAGPKTIVTVFDVSDPASPQQTSSVSIQGNLIDTRRVDDSVYLVTQKDISWDYQVLNEIQLTEEQQQAIEDAAQLEDPAERAATMDELKKDVRPLVAERFSDSDIVDSLKTRYLADEEGDPQTIVDCDDMLRPSIDSESMSLLNVLAFSLEEPEDVDGVALVSSGWHVYASQNSLYVARDSRNWDWFASEQPESMTHIHRFLLDEANVSYAASGSVEGFVKDRYSFSEHRGFLRVATTDQQVWWWGGPVAVDQVGAEPEPAGGGTDDAPTADGSSDGTDASGAMLKQAEQPEVQANNLFVLEEEGAELNVIGELTGYGENERIYAVRFMGDRAYVVTFRQIDPLFTLNLEDPENPTIAGELKITGFSNYLHPIEDDYLIGLGREADDEGRVTGLQVQLFDVSDDSEPTRTSQHVIEFGDGYVSSQADHDPHAFVWYDRRNLLAIPLTIQNWSENDDTSFSGLALFHITPEDGVQPAGRVSHNDFVAEAYCEEGSGISEGDALPAECFESYIYNARMLRSIFINDPDNPDDDSDSFGDYIYAISALGLSVSNVDAPGDLLTRVPF
jgi:uncharacterized secreted protein with C-terminal beta-propeller domain